jgi:hypothetical protein
MRSIKKMISMNVYRMAQDVAAERSMAAQQACTEPGREIGADTAEANERQLDEIRHTYTPSWEW